MLRTYLIFCPCFPFPCPPILSELGLYSIPPDNSLLPSFRLSHVSLSTLPPSRLLHSHQLSASYPPHHPLFKMISCPVCSQGSQRQRKGDRLIYNSKLVALACVCAWGTGQLGHTSYQSHEDRLMACLPDRPQA